jgi:hypothetical protein
MKLLPAASVMRGAFQICSSGSFIPGGMKSESRQYIGESLRYLPNIRE